MEIRKQRWSASAEGDVYLYTLSNGRTEVSVTNFGCAIVSLYVQDKTGASVNVALGYETFDQYAQDTYYMGCLVGRIANRIDGGILPVKKNIFQLPVNEPSKGNHLHGGFAGLNKKLFDLAGEQITDAAAAVVFSYRSRHMDEGYPGNLDLRITYELTAADELLIRYYAVADQDTHVNLTNHCYFNLDASKGPAIGHRLWIRSDRHLENNERFLPTGQISVAAGTPFDFSRMKRIDWRWGELGGHGYNTYYLLHQNEQSGPDAILESTISGIKMILRTSFPGVLLYSGDYLGTPYCRNQGICLETQFFPDAPNHPSFPSTLLEAGKEFIQYSSYQFGFADL